MGGNHLDQAGDPFGEPHKENILTRLVYGVYNMFDRPVTWFRETIIEPNQQKYPYYHLKFARVPTIDQCWQDDISCYYEADQQYKRDRMVDSEIIHILRYRMHDCIREEYPETARCLPMREAYDEAAANWFAKYGDMRANHTVLESLMKQKHRLIWERRHGKVGTGMKDKNECSANPDSH